MRIEGVHAWRYHSAEFEGVDAPGPLVRSSREEKMALRGTDPESNINSYTYVNDELHDQICTAEGPKENLPGLQGYLAHKKQHSPLRPL